MKIIERETMSDRIRRILDLTEPWKRLERSALRDPAAVDRALTLSAAHRLLGTLKDETNSRAIHDECEDVMAKLSKIVEG